jgi:hypothetical protein
LTERVLSLAALAGCTGQGVRVAIVDSGVHAAHPHIGGVVGGIAFDDHGRPFDDVVDRLGHGTAVAAAIHETAVAADLLIVKVFDRSLAATATALAAAIRWAASQGAHFINLSLGTTNPAHAGALQEAMDDAMHAGASVVAAAPDATHHWLPGAVPGVIAVELDWGCARDECRVVVDHRGAMRIYASGYPRPIPGVPPERNLQGHSFAVANATGLLALAREDATRSISSD